MRIRHLLSLLAICTLVSSGRPAEQAVTSPTVKKLFLDPPRGYSSAPLWVWNDRLTDDQVAGTLRDLAAQKVRQVFVHPRPGLMTPYLSGEWFRLWKIALAEAERLDMNVWIYDENSYPSGFAGGFVPEAMPESRGRGLILKEEKRAPAWKADLVAVFRLRDDGYENVGAKLRAGERLPEDRYLVASVARAQISPWHGGRFYVDLLYPGVTQKFLEVTMGPCRRELGAHFGKRIPGVFTDEPELRSAGDLPWTDDLPAQFEKRWGYDLTDHLPALSHRVGDWKKIRHNYFQTLLELFIERWARPYYDYCERHGLEFTGHYWEHEWPGAARVPDNMALSAWQQRPGIDILMNQYREEVHAQFGNVRAVKEIASVANQLGRERTLCEAYGAGGWDLRFEDMKRIGDWMYALGVNTLDEHLSYVTVRGARKRDHPQSFSSHEPWWEDYHVNAGYFARLSAALSQGEQRNRVLVLEPTTTAWMYNASGGRQQDLERFGTTFQQLVVDLEKAQVEFDLGCEDVMVRHGSAGNRMLKVGRRDYSVLVFPPGAENLNSRTADLIERFLDGGGALLACDAPPERIDGSPSPRGAALARSPGWRRVEPASLAERLSERPEDGFRITRTEGDKGILYHHRRRLADGEILFLVNTSNEAACSGVVESSARGAEKWDPATGRIEPAFFERQPRGIRLPFGLPPVGSVLLFLSKAEGKPAAPYTPTIARQAASGPMRVSRIAPNVLVLDYVDLTAGKESAKDAYFYQAQQLAFKANGMERNPWDSAVQFRDELISKTFPPDSGFEATYRFHIAGPVPASLRLVVERPDLYEIRCNGAAARPMPGAWWLDKAFGIIDIAGTARTGENEIRLKAAPMTIFHEIEPAYLLGEFSLRPRARGFEIAPETGLRAGAWNGQGCPFYAAGVRYSMDFEIPKASGEYLLQLPKWLGSIARVEVNGRPAGHILSSPGFLQIAPFIRPGTNRIDVTVIGTLKNTLGPHHGDPALGTAWPAMFHQAPAAGPPAGETYSTVGYGLFEPFELSQVARKED